MRVVFMGTPAFAVRSLRALADSHDVVCVVTQPDRARGRGREPVPSPVKEIALDLDLPLLQPHSLDEEFVAAISNLAPDVICVAAYGRILGDDILAIPRHGCINVHASLLPRHRGAAPVHRAILAGDAETGVSIMRMETGLDTGPVALEREIPLLDQDAEGLTAELATLGAQALLEVLTRIEEDTVTWDPQPDQGVTYAEKISADDVALDPSLTVEETLRRVRASSPSARAKVCVGGMTLEVVEATRIDRDVAPGEFSCEKQHLVIGVADGAVSLTRVRPPGKGEMQGCAFARGARLDTDSSWTCPS